MRILILLYCFIGFCTWSQPNYTILTNTNPYPQNLFFQVGGPPSKPVNIVDASSSATLAREQVLSGAVDANLVVW